MTPEATVVIPAYNAGRWIEVMLASLDAQIDAPPFEVVVADNGSTDDTAERVRAWSVGRPFVRLVDASGVQGAAHARNEGIRAARSNLILMCDADDAVSRHWVRRLTEALRDHRYAGGPTVRWPFDKEPRPGSWVADLRTAAAKGGRPEAARLQGIPFAPAGNCAVRRDTIVEAGGWDESLKAHEDPELALRLARRGVRMHFVEDAVIYYRQRGGAREMLRTHVRYALPRPGIVSQYADMGLTGSARVAARDLVAAVTEPRRWLRRDDRQEQAARLGDDIGYILGWLLNRTTPRHPMTPLAARPGLPPAVIFVMDQLIRPNGILSSVEALAGQFAAAGVPVIVVHEGVADPRLAASVPTYNQKPGWRLTTHMPDFAQSRPALRPLRRLFTSVVWRPWTRRRNRAFLASLPARSLMIGAGLEGTSFLLEGDAHDVVLVAQVHLSYSALSIRTLCLVRKVANWSRATTALTGQDAEKLTADGVARCLEMPNPVLLPDRVPPAGERECLAVYIGRLSSEKQVDQAIRAFAIVAPSGWRFEIYGQGPSRAMLADSASGVDADVRIMGTTDDVASVLGRARLNILPSRAEGLPMSILEAGAFGVPTVAYDCAPGVREAVGPGGVLVRADDEAGLANVLGELMTDEPRRESLAAAAVEHTRQFSGPCLADRWVDLWRSLTGTGDNQGVH